MKVGLLLWAVCGPVLAQDSPPASEVAPACRECHAEKTPGLVSVWAGSAHAAAGVGCVECHGSDQDIHHPTPGGQRVPVRAPVCAGCHEDAARGHATSKHGIGFRAGRACSRNEPPSPERDACSGCHGETAQAATAGAECARFLKQSRAMQRVGCLSCHKVENRCDSCHSAHDTDPRIAGAAETCGTCHMGPDHPQYEMWVSSKHGVLFGLKGESVAPSCVRCHMPDGEHDVSQGISMGLSGQAYPEERRARERAVMLDRCEQCHARSFAARQLEDGDQIQSEGQALLEQGAAIIRRLEAQGLLLPPPSERPAHPLSGPALELGSQMLYEELSEVEALYFEMKKYHYVISYKGAFHSNPDYAHWYGNAPLKLTLAKIQSQALLLERLLRLERLEALGGGRTGESGPDTLADELRALRRRFLSGRIDEQEYRAQKRAVLDRHDF